MTYLMLSLVDTRKSYCYRPTQKEWPNMQTHAYEDTHTQNKNQNTKKNSRKQKPKKTRQSGEGGGKKKRKQGGKKRK